MLFDKDTKKITAILDFDWSYVSNPFDEFTSLLSDLGCNITHADNEINAAILSGDFTTLPANLDEKSTKQWEVAKVWNTAIKKSSAVSPSDMKGVDKIRDMVRLQTLLCPFELGSESMLKQMDDEKKARLRAETEANLVQLLEKYGF
jgi:predicted GTPase